MPTKPIDEFIPRTIENAQLKEIFNSFSGLISETVNFASHVFRWCIDSIRQGDENVPIMLSFRHIFDLLDSISILIRKSCADPSKILLRSIFESLLNVEYVFEKKTEQRGKDFLVWHRFQKLKVYRRHDPRDQMYKDFKKKWEEDDVFKKIKFFDIPDIEKHIASLERLLELPGYKESVTEYRRLKKKTKTGKAPAHWFSMHDGPKNIEELASYLRRPVQYEILYRHWSELAHGTDIIRGKFKVIEKGGVSFSQLRLPTDVQSVTSLAVSFALSTIRLFVNHFVKEESAVMGEWYKSEIRSQYLAISSNDIIRVE